MRGLLLSGSPLIAYAGLLLLFMNLLLCLFLLALALLRFLDNFANRSPYLALVLSYLNFTRGAIQKSAQKML